MNIFNKAFCRAFQLAFRIAIPFLPYREPEQFASIEELAQPLKKQNIASVLLVTDGVLKQSGATETLENMLHAAGIRCAVFHQVRPNPTVNNVEAALAMYLTHGCQCLIAFGGGSAIDCAKAVGARVAYPKKTLTQMKGILRVWRKLPPLVAIPTTAGTGMDALTHAVEAYIGRSTTKETRALAKEAVKLVFENLETAYLDGNNHEARKNMLRAAYAAGVAFSKSYVGYIHAIAHSLGGQYNIPHGLANSVLLPYALESYGKRVHKKLHQLAIVAGVATESDTHMAAAEKFISAIRRLNGAMGIPEKLSGIRKEDIPAMAKHAHREANPLYPVPTLMDAKELEPFYYTVADWSESK